MLIGNLTRNPEMKTTTTGRSVTSFGVATSRQWTGQDGQKQEQTEFHNVVAWGKLGEICNQYLMKGKKIYVEGRLQTHEWEGQDGVKRQRTEIIADSMIMLDRGPAGVQNTNAVPKVKTVSIEEPASSTTPLPVDQGEEIRVEDIPF